MQSILKNKHLRRNFWVSYGLLLIVLLLIKFFVIGEINDISTHGTKFSSGIMEALIATLLVTAAISAFIFYLTPEIEPTFGTEFLSSYEFDDYFDSVLKKTNEWHFRGGFGSYLRTAVLPSLNTIASTNQTPVIVNAQILNPKNEKLCILHASLRNSVNSSKKKLTAVDVKINLYSTIVTSAIFENNNHFLDITVYLNNFFSTDRVDICTDYGIITKEDRKVPGLKFSKESSHYKAYMGDLSVTQKQADIVGKLTKQWDISTLNAKDVREILNDLNFTESSFSEENYEEISKIVNEAKIPYA